MKIHAEECDAENSKSPELKQITTIHAAETVIRYSENGKGVSDPPDVPNQQTVVRNEEDQPIYDVFPRSSNFKRHIKNRTA